MHNTKKILVIFFCVLLGFFQSSAFADEVIFDKDYEVTIFGLLIKLNDKFVLSKAQEAKIIVTKTNMNKKFKSGTIWISGSPVYITDFLKSDATTYTKDFWIHDTGQSNVNVFLSGNSKASVNIKIQLYPPPTINTFSINPSTIYKGNSANLNWNVDSATSTKLYLSTSQPPLTVSNEGTKVVSPNHNTTYKIEARCHGLVSSKSVEIIVQDPPPTISFNVAPEEIFITDTARLSWNTYGAEFCSIKPNIGSVEINGSKEVQPTTTTTYTISATGPTGTSTAQATVSVITKPSITFSITPANINLGEECILKWETKYARQGVSINNGIGPVSQSGSIKIRPARDRIYEISATGNNTVVKSSAKVTVNLPAPVITLNADNTNMILGDETILRWEADFADS
ncbi:MAG: hypothetical protein MI749_19105, partial [Desulfovibrionales bacterium]|nr:hypothetical protein [Desulfovibrionales bacterium]